MTNKSNDYGRAYEYIFLILLQHEINKVRSVVIEENSSYKSAKRAWDDVNCKLQDSLKTRAYAALDFVISLEPLILQN
ncbi:HaeIII family restriction endonuclease, partial [bacterium]|nr:HaeIII family restriction endonuclease [bacterium]